MQAKSSPVEKPVSTAVPEESKDKETTGSLSHITFSSFDGVMLTDQQRVTRFNDMRALQLLFESDFNEEESAKINRFL